MIVSDSAFFVFFVRFGGCGGCLRICQWDFSVIKKEQGSNCFCLQIFAVELDGYQLDFPNSFIHDIFQIDQR